MLLLKFIHKVILSGTPLLMYNPFSNLLNAPFDVKPYSTYINFRLNATQQQTVQQYIHQHNPAFHLTPIKIHPTDTAGYFLSVNIYNCSSPLFTNNEAEITRCEINTYVKNDETGNIGTMILDYSSNERSLDPVDLFVEKNPNTFFRHNSTTNRNILQLNVENAKIRFRMDYDTTKEKRRYKHRPIDPALIEYTDNIFYKNGIYDKLYYDSSLVEAKTASPVFYTFYGFHYLNLTFDKIHSLFFFENHLHFICSLWHNLFHNEKK